MFAVKYYPSVMHAFVLLIYNPSQQLMSLDFLSEHHTFLQNPLNDLKIKVIYNAK